MEKLPQHVERLILSRNGLYHLSVDHPFACESLIELQVTQNSLRSLHASNSAAGRYSFATLSSGPLHGNGGSANAEHQIGSGLFWPKNNLMHSQQTTANHRKPEWPLLSVCHRLRSLDVSGNLLGVLGAGGFKRLKRLDQLRLDHNQIHNIERHAFAGLGQLRLLSLRQNQLNEINSEMFQNLNTLKVRKLRFSFEKLFFIVIINTKKYFEKSLLCK